ncbi:MAG: helix-turn-helix transcriptional regulator [Candidatus Cloacimonadales bacterium]|nr:helix-turn-helix transcriptional regulator [Candidatus Cloacimonadales bacterium]
MKIIFIPDGSYEGDQVEKQNSFNIISNSFVDIVAEQLKQKKLSKSWLANKLKISAPAVSKLLVRNTNPTLKTIAEVADALSIIIELKFTSKNNLLKRLEDDVFGRNVKKEIIVNPTQTKEF